MSHDSKFAPEGLHHDHVQAAQSPPGHEHDDHWDGATYLARPGVRETAAINAENVRVALTAAGLDPATFSKLSVIEVGCGPGLVTEHLAKTYGSVHAIETSASQLRTFSHQPVATAPNVTWGLVSIRPGIDLNVKVFSPTRTDQHRKVAAPRDTFDVAVANLVVHHVDDLTRLFSGMLSVLKPGGIAVITEFTLAEDGTDVISDMRARAHGQQKKEVEKDVGKTVNAPGHFHSVFTVESLSEKLERAGFVNCHGERCTAVPVFPGEPPVPLIYVYAYKSKYTGGASLQREASHRENLDR